MTFLHFMQLSRNSISAVIQIISDSWLGIEPSPLSIFHLSSPIYISGNWVRTKSPPLPIIILYFRQLIRNKISDITHHDFIFQAIEWEQNLRHCQSSFYISGNWVGTKSPTLPIVILYLRQLSGKKIPDYPSSFYFSGNWLGTKSPTFPTIILYFRQLSGKKNPRHYPSSFYISGNWVGTKPPITHHHFIFQAIKWEQNPRHHPWSTQNFSLAQVRKENIKRNNRRQN